MDKFIVYNPPILGEGVNDIKNTKDINVITVEVI